MTNEQRIKNMNITQLASFLQTISSSEEISNEWCASHCPDKINDTCINLNCSYLDDSIMFEAWLKLEAKD